MGIRNVSINLFEHMQDLTGIYPRWKLDCLDIAWQKIKEYNPKIADISKINLPLPSIVSIPTRKYPACYFWKSQRVGINLSKENLRYLFPKNIDSTLVHELGHHLWEHTSGRIPFGTGNVARMWQEGFAEFLQTNFFSDLVPKYVDNHRVSDQIYDEGFRRVCYIAVYHENHRDVFQVPVKWKMFEEEYQNYLKNS